MHHRSSRQPKTAWLLAALATVLSTAATSRANAGQPVVSAQQTPPDAVSTPDVQVARSLTRNLNSSPPLSEPAQGPERAGPERVAPAGAASSDVSVGQATTRNLNSAPAAPGPHNGSPPIARPALLAAPLIAPAPERHSVPVTPPLSASRVISSADNSPASGGSGQGVSTASSSSADVQPTPGAQVQPSPPSLGTEPASGAPQQVQPGLSVAGSTPARPAVGSAVSDASAPRVLSQAEVATLPFAVDLPLGFSIVRGRPGPGFETYSIRQQDRTFVMVYAGPASQFPIYTGETVQVAGRYSIVVNDGAQRRAMEHLFERDTQPREIHVWVSSLEGGDVSLAERIAQSIDPR